MARSTFAVFVLVLCLALNTEHTDAQSQPPAIPAEWRTHAEKTDYRETPNYEETMEYARRLDAASPWVRLTEFGRSGEGRALPLMLLAKGEAFTPQAAKRSAKAV